MSSGVDDVVLQLLGTVHRVHRHDDSIRAQDAEVRDDELRAVLHVQQDAIAFANA